MSLFLDVTDEDESKSPSLFVQDMIASEDSSKFSTRESKPHSIGKISGDENASRDKVTRQVGFDAWIVPPKNEEGHTKRRMCILKEP